MKMLRKGQTNQTSFKKGEHRNPKGEFKKGEHNSLRTEFGKVPAWNKGLKGAEYRKHYKRGFAIPGKGKSPPNKGKFSEWVNFKRRIRDCWKTECWRTEIFKRDNYFCQDCKIKGGILSAHHIKEFETILKENYITTYEQALACKELWDLNNGITLCWPCHRKRHRGGDINGNKN